MVRLSKNGYARHHNIHRLVAIEFIPNPHGYKEINHKDADRQNNDVSNLEWCSHQQNMAWAGKMGHMARWKNSPSEKESKHIGPSSEEPLQRIIHLHTLIKGKMVDETTSLNARTFPQIWENLSSDERESLTLEIYNAKCCRTRQTIWKWATDKVRPSTLVRETLAKVVSKAIGTKVYANTLFPEKS